jgi:hypothetical protein
MMEAHSRIDMAEIFIKTKIGTIMLDAVVSESHTSDIDITDNPVESGATMTDHAVVRPKGVSIEGVIVDYEPQRVLKKKGIGDIRTIRDGLDFAKDVLFGDGFSSMTAQAKVYVNQTMKSYAKPTDFMAKGMDVLGIRAPGKSDETDTGSRLQKIYLELIALQESRSLVDIQTGVKLYRNMLLPSISATEDQRGSLTVSITAREVQVTEIRKIDGVAVPGIGKQKAGRPASQSASKHQIGKTNPPQAGSNVIQNVKNTIGGQ